MTKGSWIWGVVFVAVAAVIGCGGGGGSSASGSGGSSAGSNGGGTGVAVGPMLVSVNPSGQIVDPLNLEPGNQVTFEVVTINSATLAVTKISGVSFNTTDTSGVAGILNPSTGAYTAGNVSSTQSFTMTGTANGTNYSESYAVNPIQALVTGTVKDTNGNAVPFANVVFYNSSGSQVGSSVAGLDGAFTASVPTSAVRFGFVASSIPIMQNAAKIPSMGYYQEFDYGSGTYDFNSNCGAPLPALTNGQVTAMPNNPTIIAAFTISGAAVTPPPPAGCTP